MLQIQQMATRHALDLTDALGAILDYWQRWQDINKGREHRESDIIKHSQLESISLFNQEAGASHNPGNSSIAKLRGLPLLSSPI